MKRLVSEIAADRSALITMMADVTVKIRGCKVFARGGGPGRRRPLTGDG
jgi:hypothetical protein